MKIRISSIPEGAIVRNENFDKIGKTPFEIESTEYLNKKIFINYDGVIKEHLITESTTDIYEDLVRKEIVEDDSKIDNKTRISEDINKPQVNSNEAIKKYSTIAAGVLILIGSGYFAYNYLNLTSNPTNNDVQTINLDVDSINTIENVESETNNNISEIDTTPKIEEIKTEIKEEVKKEESKSESSKLDENAARNIISRAIWMENSKNVDGLKNLFASNVSRYKTRNNISKNQLGGIYQEWWDNIISEEKQISSITKIDDNTYKAKINHKYDVDGSSEKEVVYYGIYKLNKDGKIIELYID